MKIRLCVRRTPSEAFDWEYAGPQVQIGRDPSCELNFQGDVGKVVSWHHARVELAGLGAVLTDLGSNNGTLVNGGPVSGTVPLKVGDQVQLGRDGPRLEVLEINVIPPVPMASPAPNVVLPATMMEPASSARPPRIPPVPRGYPPAQPPSDPLGFLNSETGPTRVDGRPDMAKASGSSGMHVRENRPFGIVWIVCYWFISSVPLMVAGVLLNSASGFLGGMSKAAGELGDLPNRLARSQQSFDAESVLVIITLLVDLLGVVMFHLGLLTIVACYGLWTLRMWGLSLARPLAMLFVVLNAFVVIASVYTRAQIVSALVGLAISIVIADYLFGAAQLSVRLQRFSSRFRTTARREWRGDE